MRFVIKLDDGTFVKTSIRKPTFTTEQQEAEVWMDQKAAVAWCVEKNLGAEVFPIDIPVAEMVPVKPKAQRVPRKAEEAE